MSLVSTYVRADDGKLYRNPTLRGQGWFICFDDDDPVEIVLQLKKGEGKKQAAIRAKEILKELGIRPIDWCESGGGMRIFKGNFRNAYAWFFEINQRIPAKAISKHDGIVDRESIYQGVIYDPKS